MASVLGVTPSVPGLSPTEARVLAALSRSPRGVASVREAARRAGTSPTATARALGRLTSVGLIVQTHVMLAKGFDPDGLAWGSRNLPASAWEHAAATRGLEPAKQALARNLARNAPDAR